MSLFGSSKKTEVGTAIVRVIEDANVPETARRSMIQAIQRSEGISDTLIENVLNGPALKMERFYRKAESGEYVFGLPNASVVNASTGGAEVRAVIQGITGESVTLEYLRFASINPVHVGWEAVTNFYGYDPETNELTAISFEKGVPVYLDDLQPIFGVDIEALAEPGTLDNWSDNPKARYTPERPINGGGLDAAAIIDPTMDTRVDIKLVWQVGSTIQRETITIGMGNYDLNREYFQAKYVTASGVTGFFTYQDGKGTYPVLDALYAVNYTTPGTYFPFVMFRHHRVNRTAEEFRDTAEFKSTESLLRILHMDYADIGSKIHENPDIEDVEQAVMMLAVPASTTNQIELRYLFDFFIRLHGQTPATTITTTQKGALTENAIVWRDADYRMTMSYGGVTRRLKAGRIGPQGTYEGDLETKTVSRTVDKVVPDELGGGTEQKTYTQTVYEKIVRHQVTHSLYEEVRVTHPTMRYDIYKNYAYEGGADTQELIIPVDRSIANNYTLMEREELYYRSLRFVFNSRVTVKVKWYESGVFKAILTIAAIVITVISIGKASPLIGLAISLGAYTLATALILATILAFMVKVYAYRVIVKEIGIEAGFVLAVAAMAIGAGMGLTGSNPGYLPDANTMLQISSNLSQANSYELQNLLSKYDGEAQAFNLEADAKQSELDKAMALLNNETLIDPFEFIGQQPLFVAGETPQDFYLRTIHSGNIGTTVFKSVESFVDISLTLPNINTTVGDTLYE